MAVPSDCLHSVTRRIRDLDSTRIFLLCRDCGLLVGHYCTRGAASLDPDAAPPPVCAGCSAPASLLAQYGGGAPAEALCASCGWGTLDLLRLLSGTMTLEPLTASPGLGT